MIAKPKWRDPLAFLTHHDLIRLQATRTPSTVQQIYDRLKEPKTLRGDPHTKASIQASFTRMRERNLVVRFKGPQPNRVYVYEISALGDHCLKENAAC